MEKKHCKWYNDEFCTNGDSPCVADYCPVVEYPELCKCRELDNGENLANSVANVANNLANEKKLTDEEIVKALLYCQQREQDCEKCYLHKAYYPCLCHRKLLFDTLDLIHRLQSENKRLKKQVEQGLKDMKLEVGIRDKEIERMTEEKRNTLEKVKSGNIVKLTKDDILWAYQMAIGMHEARIDELQKQVDEQDKEIDRLEKVVHEQSEQYYDVEQRTAVEILQKGRYCIPSGLRDWIKERYGVEVE